MAVFTGLLCLFPVGCSKISGPKTVSPSFLHLALSEDPSTLDPALITDVVGGAISAKLFDGLVAFDSKGNVRPCIAESWEILDDGKTYVFHLRKRVFFHHGREVVSDDVRKSFQRVLDLETSSARRWVLDKILGAKSYRGEVLSGPLEGIETPDTWTVRIRLESPYAPFLSLLAMPNAVVIPAEEAARLGKGFGQHPVGTGPFMLAAWERDKRLVLKKNPSYFAGVALVEGVEYRIIPEPWAALTEFKQGNLDWVAVPQGNLEQFLSDPSLGSRLRGNAGLNTYYLGLNCAKPPLNRPKVRKALAMAIDREKMARVLMKQGAIPAIGPVPPALDGKLASIPSIPYDPPLARRWLREEGAADLHLTLYQASSLDTLEMMEVVQSYLSRVGVTVEIVQREWSSFKEAVIRGTPDMFFLSWWADYPDAENFLFPNFFSTNAGAGGNKSRFADPMVDEMIVAANRQTDKVARDALHRRCVQRLVDQSPWVFLWHRTEWVVTQPWVQGMEFSAVYNADKYMTVRLVRQAAP